MDKQSTSSFKTSVFSSYGESVIKSKDMNKELYRTTMNSTKSQMYPTSNPLPVQYDYLLNQTMSKSQYVKEPKYDERLVDNTTPFFKQYKEGPHLDIHVNSVQPSDKPFSMLFQPFQTDRKQVVKTSNSRPQSKNVMSEFSFQNNAQSQNKPQIFSYFFHDMEQEEKDAVIPKKREQPLCKTHQEPVVMFSLPFAEFICFRCFDLIGDQRDCYGLSDLEKPCEILYAGISAYIEGGKLPMLEKHIFDYKQYFRQVKDERYRYLTESEKGRIDSELNDILYDLQSFWKKVEQMQREYKKLKEIKDFETILLMYERWTSICYDFREKYLNFEYIRNLVNKKIDPIMRSIAMRAGLCFMCMTNEANLICNNLKDDYCITCKECANFCYTHGYFCRVHQEYHGERSRDKQYLGDSCTLCHYDKKFEQFY